MSEDPVLGAVFEAIEEALSEALSRSPLRGQVKFRQWREYGFIDLFATLRTGPAVATPLSRIRAYRKNNDTGEYFVSVDRLENSTRGLAFAKRYARYDVREDGSVERAAADALRLADEALRWRQLMSKQTAMRKKVNDGRRKTGRRGPVRRG